MKVKSIQIFSDKFTGDLYPVGTVLAVDDGRAEDLISRGLAEPIEDTVWLFGDGFPRSMVIRALKMIGIKVPANTGEKAILSKVESLDEEQLLKLKDSL